MHVNLAGLDACTIIQLRKSQKVDSVHVDVTIVTFLALSCQLSFKFKFTGQLIEPFACVDKLKHESLLFVNILPI